MNSICPMRRYFIRLTSGSILMPISIRTYFFFKSLCNVLQDTLSRLNSDLKQIFRAKNSLSSQSITPITPQPLLPFSVPQIPWQTQSLSSTPKRFFLNPVSLPIRLKTSDSTKQHLNAGQTVASPSKEQLQYYPPTAQIQDSRVCLLPLHSLHPPPPPLATSPSRMVLLLPHLPSPPQCRTIRLDLVARVLQWRV